MRARVHDRGRSATAPKILLLKPCNISPHFMMMKMKILAVGGTNSAGELYILQTRHCIQMRIPVYKVGRASDAGRRLQQYPKGSRLIVRLPVSHMLASERIMLAICNNNFVQRKDFGTEYFQGDICLIVGILAMVVRMFPVQSVPGRES